MLDKQRLLHFGDHQNLGLRLGGKHRALVLGEVFVTPPVLVQRVAQGLRLVFVATVGSVVDIQTRHFVEANHSIYRALGQVGVDPGGELFVALVIEQRLDRHHHHLKTGRHFAFPDRRVDANGMTTRLALQGDAHKIALQATERESICKG